MESFLSFLRIDPGLKPYSKLSPSERWYSQNTVLTVLNFILALNYEIRLSTRYQEFLRLRRRGESSIPTSSPKPKNVHAVNPDELSPLSQNGGDSAQKSMVFEDMNLSPVLLARRRRSLRISGGDRARSSPRRTDNELRQAEMKIMIPGDSPHVQVRTSCVMVPVAVAWKWEVRGGKIGQLLILAEVYRLVAPLAVVNSRKNSGNTNCHTIANVSITRQRS